MSPLSIKERRRKALRWIGIAGVAALVLSGACRKGAETLNEPWCREWKILVRDALTGDGKVSNQYEGAWHAGDMTPDRFGMRPHYEAVGAHLGILELHPVSPSEPAKLKYAGQVTPAAPILTVVAGGNIHGDGVLQCRVNGGPVGEYVLDGSRWTTCRFDLSAFASRDADVQLWGVAGGTEPWKYEHLYIDAITFETVQ